MVPANQRVLDAGRDDQQVRRAIDQGFEKARQRGGLFLVEIIDLIEDQHKRPIVAGSEARQSDEHLLDLLIVEQGDGTLASRRRWKLQFPPLLRIERLSGQPAHRQRRQAAVFLAAIGAISRLEESKQHLPDGTINQARAGQIACPQPLHQTLIGILQLRPGVSAQLVLYRIEQAGVYQIE